MRELSDASLAERTTLRLGGPARRLLEAGTEAELIEAVAGCDDAGEALLLLAGGSNLVIADAGWDGTVVAIGNRGIEERGVGERVELTVAAGEPWDELVARTVAEGLAGLECLSGIPGSCGATPIQNVGAYGEEVSTVIAAVRCWDREAGAVVELAPAECGFGYRSSAFKGSDRWLVLAVTFALARAPAGPPIGYAQLAAALGVELGSRVPLAAAREAVLELRRSKGMVVDPGDPDSVSAGSFFTNPILEAEAFERLARRAAERLGAEQPPPSWPEQGNRVKTSAAWLIERAGFARGYGSGSVGLSAKHTLALVNRGGATSAELAAFAREIRDGVEAAFGVRLVPEPKLVGIEL
jgi:UDP-N-acetylmuramate dehydrogenase